MGKIKAGETELTIGTIADGQYLKRVGTEIQSATVTGGSGGGVIYDTQANRPAAGTQGREFIPTNGYGPTRQIDSGAAWLNFYNGLQCSNPPATGSFTAVNQSYSTLAADGDGLLLTYTGTAASATRAEAYVVAVPSAPYSFTVGMQILYVHPVNQSDIGICITNGTSNPKIFWTGLSYINSNYYDIEYWSNVSTVSGTSFETIPAPPISSSNILFFRIRDDNTNRFFEVSANGKDFADLYATTMSRTEQFTPTHAGLFCAKEGGTLATTFKRVQAKIFHWSLG